MISRAEIAAMVGPDFETLRSRINPNLSRPEIEAAWNIDQIKLLAPRVKGISDEEIRRVWAIYLEEMQAMIDRRTRQLDFDQSLKKTAATTIVTATIWDIIFSIFR